MRRWPRLLGALLLVTLAACGGGDAVDVATPTSVDGSGATGDDPDTTIVRSYLVAGEQLHVVGRAVDSAAPARGAVEALLGGPRADEEAMGLSTSIPADVRLLDLSTSSGEAIVDLSSEFQESGGTLGESLRIHQVVWTLTQFPTIERVTFRIGGSAPSEGLGSHGFEHERLERAHDHTPAILVESPTPGAEAADRFTVAGVANTFEATVQWRVEGPGGTTVAAGFTTATAGSGTFGTFEFVVELDEVVGTGDDLELVVFEESARDGSEINDYRVALTRS